MSRPQPRRAFERTDATAAPGDVFMWFIPRLKKFKFHVCLSFDHDFAYVNSPKDTEYDYDFPIRSRDIRFLKPTPEELSFVSCSLMKLGEARFHAWQPRLMGNLTSDVLGRMLSHFADSPTIEIEDAERLAGVAGLYATRIGSPVAPSSPPGWTGWPPEGTRPLVGRRIPPSDRPTARD